MGLVPLANDLSDAKLHDRLRVLLCPSFDAEICLTFERIGETAGLKGQGVTVDGMGVQAYLSEHGPAIAVMDNVGTNSLLRGFVAEILALAFESAENVRCRNALANTGRYVGLDLPVVDALDGPPISMIAVLGDPDERREFLAAIAKVRTRGGL
jgi:hypothetical protein